MLIDNDNQPIQPEDTNPNEETDLAEGTNTEGTSDSAQWSESQSRLDLDDEVEVVAEPTDTAAFDAIVIDSPTADEVDPASLDAIIVDAQSPDVVEAATTRVDLNLAAEPEADSPHESETIEPVETLPKPRVAPPITEKPAWKIEAERIYDSRQAKRRHMIEERRQLDAQRAAARHAEDEALRTKRTQMDERLRQRWTEQERKQQANFEAMMQQVRDEKERKRREREAMDAKLREERTSKHQQSGRDLDSRSARLAKDDDE